MSNSVLSPLTCGFMKAAYVTACRSVKIANFYRLKMLNIYTIVTLC